MQAKSLTTAINTSFHENNLFLSIVDPLWASSATNSITHLCFEDVGLLQRNFFPGRRKRRCAENLQFFSFVIERILHLVPFKSIIFKSFYNWKLLANQSQIVWCKDFVILFEDLKILRFQRETPHTSNCPTVAVFRFKNEKKNISVVTNRLDWLKTTTIIWC